jgi:diguanylate cyclase (GGDEF)-like protein
MAFTSATASVRTESPHSSTPSGERTAVREVERPVSAAAWQLLRDDVFDRLLDDAELFRFLAERAEESPEPHADVVRLMLGMSLPEEEAHKMFLRVVDHRREMSHALGRPVHVRVAALDLLTTRPPNRRTSRESRPIMVAPELLERALEEAGSDGMTGLPRGSHFMHLLEYELLQRSRRVVVVYIDLDGFKEVNDQYGHARGDEVLRTMAEAARSVLRRGDVIARLGGDEFGLMLVDVAPDEARAAIDRLRFRFEELTADVATSFSAGLAFATAGETAAAVLARADRAMYEEKRQRSKR